MKSQPVDKVIAQIAESTGLTFVASKRIEQDPFAKQPATLNVTNQTAIDVLRMLVQNYENKLAFHIDEGFVFIGTRREIDRVNYPQQYPLLGNGDLHERAEQSLQKLMKAHRTNDWAAYGGEAFYSALWN